MTPKNGGLAMHFWLHILRLHFILHIVQFTAETQRRANMDLHGMENYFPANKIGHLVLVCKWLNRRQPKLVMVH